MSRVSELANAEAEAAEAAEAEGAEPEPEPESEPTEPEPVDPAAIGDAEIRKAERAISEQKARLSKILGDEMVAHDCPLCSALGYLPELPPPGAMLEVTDDEGRIGFAMRAPGVPPEYLDARDKAACDWCDGYGQVRTHSKNPNAAIAGCTKCNGNGWVLVAADSPIPVYTESVTASAATLANGQPMAVPPDAWDRPYGHAHYGIPPSMVGS